MNPELLTALQAVVGEKQVFTDARSLEIFSLDHYWYSPVLLEMLKDKRADVIVAPDSPAQLLEVVRLAVQYNVPLTVRGAGTGNYGQAVPLAGGIVANMHRLNKIISIDTTTGLARVEAGVRMGALERKARELGWELKIYPSTWATCTIGGFVGGGFGGVGSINHGTLWDGNVLAMQILTLTEQPEILEVAGWDCAPMIHAYGTTAVMTELSIPLTPATEWVECVLSFASLESAIKYGHALALDKNIKKRELAINENGIPQFFTPLVADGGVKAGRDNVLLEVQATQLAEAVKLAEQFGGTLDWQKQPEEYHKGAFAISDFTWNHTTLWALKTEPTITYLQARFEAARVLEQVQLLKIKFGDEILMHLEFIHENLSAGGDLVAASLPLVRYTTKERLYEMIDYCEQIGVHVANPHVYYLDEDPRWSGEAVLEGVKKFNPKGLLNPGKIKQLETGEVGVKAGSWFS